jgi:PAS domain S-box-containing protein
VIQAAGGGLKMVRPTHVGSLAEHKPSILNGLPPSQTVSAASVAGLLEALMVDIGATPPADEGDQRPPGLLRMLETQLSRIVDAAQTAQAGESAPNEQLDSWQETISALRFASLPYLKGAQLAQANDLWQQAQALVGEITLRIQGVEQVRIDSQARRLRSLSQTLITTFDAAQVMDILAEALPGLGIPSAYLSLYEDSDNPTNQARLILAYTENGRIPLETAGRTFPTCTLLPADVLPQDRPYSLVVHPLYFGQTHLGVALFELGVRQGVLYEALRGEISSALQGALLVRRVQERSAELARQQYILNTFMENVPDPIYFKDLDSRITRANKAHAIMLGLSDLAEEIGKSDLDFFPEELARAKHEQEREIIRTGQPVLNVEESNGMGRWALTTKMPLRDENGNIIGTFGISRDISERKRTEETLAHERNLLRTLIDSIPDQIYAKDTQGRFTLANAAQAHLRGMTTPDELVGKSDFDFYPDALAEQYRASEQPILSAGQSLLEQEEPNLDAANNQIWTATTKVPLRNQQGQIIGLVGVSRDVTERRKLMADLERRALELQTAAEISRATSSILSLDELLPQAVELIRTRFDLYYIGLFLMDETGQWAVLRAGTGEPGRKMLEAGHKLKSSGASMIGWCIANSQARIALDVGEEVVRFSNPLLPLTRSEAALPIISRGRVIGAMTIQSDQPAALTQEDITVLQTIADQLANAIENARLFEQTQSALATVEATHRRYLGEQWKTYLAGAVERPIGYVVNPTGLAPASDVWTPEMEQALSLGAPVTLSTPPEGNAAPARSALAVPIQLHGLPIGVLDFYDEGAERAWSKDERALVEALADQIALALENARLLEQTQQRARREQLIAEIAAKMRAAPDVEGVLRATVHEIRRALGVSHGVIRLGEAAHTAAGNGQTGEGDDRNE